MTRSLHASVPLVLGLSTSHNAPEPILLEITDRLGIAVLDENRVFATEENCPGCPGVPSYDGDPVAVGVVCHVITLSKWLSE
jgi:hypothetical protein